MFSLYTCTINFLMNILYFSYSEKVLNRRSQNETKVEYTTEQIRLDMAENEALYKTKPLSINDCLISENNDKQNIIDFDQLPGNHQSTVTDIISKQEEPIKQKQLYEYSIGAINADHTDTPTGTSKKLDIKYDSNSTFDNQLDNSKEPSDTKSKKKRRKRSMMKKKPSISSNCSVQGTPPSTSKSISNTPRKNSSSSSLGSVSTVPSEPNDIEIASNVGF